MEDPEKKVERGRSRIAGNSVSLAVAGGAGMVFTLIQLAILSRFLGGDEFGLFVSLRGFSLLLSTLILLGLPQVLIRFLPSYQSRGHVKKARVLFLASSAAVIALGILMLYGAGFWKGFIPGSAREALNSADLLWISLASVALALKLLLYGAFNGQREMRYQMVFELFYLVSLTAAIIVLRGRLGLLLLFRLIFILNALIYITGIPVFLVLAGKASQKGGTDDSGGVVHPPVLSYMANALLLSLVALAFTDFDRFVMSSALPLSAISLFHIASRVNGLIKKFLGFPIVALQPEVTRVYEEGRWDELGDKIVLFTKVSLVASIFLVAILAITGREVITAISGSSFNDAYRILLILLPGVPLAALIAPLLSTMKGLHFMRWAIVCDFAWMTVYFGTFFIFIPFWGVLGVAFAQLLASVVQTLLAVYLSRKEGFYRGPGKRVGRVLAACLLVAAGGIPVTWFLGLPAAIVILVLSPLILRAILVRLNVFEKEERETISLMIPSPLGRRVLTWMTAGGEV